MSRTTLLAPVLALLLASPLAGAQDAPAATAASAAAPAPHAGPAPHSGRIGLDQRMHRLHRDHGPGMGAFADLRALERLYREDGREKELTGLYNEVLAKSQDPHLRTYAYHRLARLQARPANVDQAIATLRKSLAENLANEATMRAERERMRAQWRQPGAAAQPAPR
jgi:hypothetical protein